MNKSEGKKLMRAAARMGRNGNNESDSDKLSFWTIWGQLFGSATVFWQQQFHPLFCCKTAAERSLRSHGQKGFYFYTQKRHWLLIRFCFKVIMHKSSNGGGSGANQFPLG